MSTLLTHHVPIACQIIASRTYSANSKGDTWPLDFACQSNRLCETDKYPSATHLISNLLANHQLSPADKPALALCFKALRSAFNVLDECYHLAGTLFHIIWNIVPDEQEHYSSLSKTI